jgi:dolichol kinase
MEEVWGLLLLMVRGLMLLKLWLVVVVLVLLLVLLLLLLLLRGSWVVENLLSSLLNMMICLARRIRRREKATWLGIMMRDRGVQLWD